METPSRTIRPCRSCKAPTLGPPRGRPPYCDACRALRPVFVRKGHLCRGGCGTAVRPEGPTIGRAPYCDDCRDARIAAGSAHLARQKEVRDGLRPAPAPRPAPRPQRFEARARLAVQAAIREGLIRPASALPCAVGPDGCSGPHAHHHRSYQPKDWLDVECLCLAHHMARHREMTPIPGDACEHDWQRCRGQLTGKCSKCGLLTYGPPVRDGGGQLASRGMRLVDCEVRGCGMIAEDPKTHRCGRCARVVRMVAR